MAKRTNGEGSYIFIQSRNRWRWTMMFADPITDELKTKTLYDKDLSTLKNKVKEWLQAYDAGKVVTNNITVNDWIIKYQKIIKNSVKPKTWENYDITARNHILPIFGKLKLTKLTAERLQEYFNSLLASHSARTVATIRTHFIVCLNKAMELGYLTMNPAKLTSAPRIPQRETKALTTNQIKKLEAVLKSGEYCAVQPNENDENDEARIYLQKCYLLLVQLALATGMREGEILGLKWEKINYKKRLLHVDEAVSPSRGKKFLDDPKSSRSIRKIYIPTPIITKLQEWQTFQREFAKKYNDIFSNKHDLVFTSATGNIISASNFRYRCFAPALEKARIKGATFHTLRHTHASQLLAAGVNVQVVAERLGHSSVTTTMDIYAHLLPTLQDAAKDKIEELAAMADKEIENE